MPNSDMQKRSLLWNEDFSHRPSWCDANLSLKLIKQNKASGNVVALQVRALLQRILFSLGCYIQRHYRNFLLFGTFSMIFFCVGLCYVKIEVDIDKLWVQKGGRLDEERQYVRNVFKLSDENRPKALHGSSNYNVELSSVNGGARYLVLIQTNGFTHDSVSSVEGQKNPELFKIDDDILDRERLLLHASVLEDISRMTVELFGEKWSLSDICFKPDAPTIEGDMASQFEHLVERIVPCIMITPVDCFWEGSAALGPFPPVTLPDVLTWIIPSLSKNITWKNLDPATVINDLIEYVQVPELETLKSLFHRAGIDHGYLTRPCLDPLNSECPRSSPNHVDICPVVHNFLKWNEDEDGVFILAERNHRPVKARTPNFDLKTDLTNITGSFDFSKFNNSKESLIKVWDVFGVLEKPESATGHVDDVGVTHHESLTNNNWNSEMNTYLNNEEVVDSICLEYKDQVREILRMHPKLLAKFIPQYFNMPNNFGTKNSAYDPEILLRRENRKRFGNEMTGGCSGFARTYMKWPEDLIIGGVKRENDKIISAEALQTVLMIVSAEELYHRVKFGHKKSLNAYDWTIDAARTVLSTWQKNFTDFVYNHVNNSKKVFDVSTSYGESSIVNNGRQLHPFTGSSINEMMTSFSNFNPMIIGIGYAIMIVYASFSLISCKDRGVNSSMGLAVAGCFLVTLAGLAGLGCCMLVGLYLNAATTQIVPFLALGLGVDDMFLLVHSYVSIVSVVDNEEIGLLLKETGLSALLTSLNNILAFLAGSILPVPALQNFCLQVAILLTFNLIAILTVYPAMLTMDLTRRKRQRMDVLCCFKMLRGNSTTFSSSSSSSTNNLHSNICETIAKNGNGVSLGPHNRHVSTGVDSGVGFGSAYSSYSKNRHRNSLGDNSTRSKDYSEKFGTINTRTLTFKNSLQKFLDENSHHQNGIENKMPHPSVGNSIPPRVESLTNEKNVASSNTTDYRFDSTGRLLDPGKVRTPRNFPSNFCDFTLQKFVDQFYVSWLQRPSVKVLILLIHICLLCLGIIGCNRIKLGLELTDVLPKNTPPYEFLNARQKYFSFYPFNIILKGPFDIAKHQALFWQFRRNIYEIPYVVRSDDEIKHGHDRSLVFGSSMDNGVNQFWLHLMSEWLTDLQAKFDDDFASGFITRQGLPKNKTNLASSEAILAYKLLCNAGNDTRRNRVGNTRLVDKDGIINPEGFYNYLTAWYEVDPMTYYVSQGNLYPTPMSWKYDEKLDRANLKIPPSSMPTFSQIPFFANRLVDTPSIIDLIKRVRHVCEEFSIHGLHAYPEGIPFTFWEQYLNLRNHLAIALGVVMVAVFVIMTLLLVNPWTACLVVLILVMLVIELAGFMGLIGVKLNAVSAVSLITAVGIGVEFTVHVSLSFLTCLGNRNRRIALALSYVAVPVIHGGISTLLGVLMLALSEFEFVFKYFFLVLSALIVLGLFNGLCVLPVFLSIVGPNSEVRTLNGSDCLTPPPTPPISPLITNRRRQDVGRLLECPEIGHHHSQNLRFNHDNRQNVSDSLSVIWEEQENHDKPSPLIKVKGARVILQPNSANAQMVNSPVNVTSNTKVNLHLQVGEKTMNAIVDRCSKLLTKSSGNFGQNINKNTSKMTTERKDQEPAMDYANNETSQSSFGHNFKINNNFIAQLNNDQMQQIEHERDIDSSPNCSVNNFADSDESDDDDYDNNRLSSHLTMTNGGGDEQPSKINRKISATLTPPILHKIHQQKDIIEQR